MSYKVSDTAEVWKDIEGLEGLYQVSSLGRIKSFPKPNCNTRLEGIKILKTGYDQDGYKLAGLTKNGKTKTYKVHRLVAQAFIPNPEGLPQINHKNEIKDDNRVENLEWCDQTYNNNYGNRMQKFREKQRNHPNISKVVEQYSLEGTFIASFPSIKEASRQTGVSDTLIGKCCKQKIRQGKGFVWKYSSK